MCEIRSRSVEAHRGSWVAGTIWSRGVSLHLQGVLNQDALRMGQIRLRRLDRSRPTLERDIRLHDVVMLDLVETARREGMSIGLYVQTLLDANRTPDGQLPSFSQELADLDQTHETKEPHVSAA